MKNIKELTSTQEYKTSSVSLPSSLMHKIERGDMAYTVTTPHEINLFSASVPSGQTPLRRLVSGLGNRWRTFLDRVNPMVVPRWIVTGILLFVYFLRVYFGEGWYIITYALGIYALNLLVAFLSPLYEPEDTEDGNDSGEDELLPSTRDDEFRPFVRRVPEFKFWYSISKAIVISMFLTVTRFTDIPVFWPILLLYFLVLFAVTMKRQIQHMIRYRYVPFSWGKRTYASGGNAEPKSDK